MTTTHQDAATRAAEALKRAFCIERLVDDPEYPGEDEWVIADKEEIASILRPFMETKKPGAFIEMHVDTFSELSTAAAKALEESKRKDEEIAKVKKMLEDLCDIIEKNKSIHIWETRNRAMLAKKELKLMNPPDDGKTLERGER
jgi:hypothetical protein